MFGSYSQTNQTLILQREVLQLKAASKYIVRQNFKQKKQEGVQSDSQKYNGESSTME
jgi:hypothetical protein